MLSCGTRNVRQVGQPVPEDREEQQRNEKDQGRRRQGQDQPTEPTGVAVRVAVHGTTSDCLHMTITIKQFVSHPAFGISPADAFGGPASEARLDPVTTGWIFAAVETG
ncbi:hypothetical protein Mame01_47440 [Microbispora amethystogenes]|nr:hypothetical protein Mame01_47440 [Microbispora amethystogenes]